MYISTYMQYWPLYQSWSKNLPCCEECLDFLLSIITGILKKSHNAALPWLHSVTVGYLLVIKFTCGHICWALPLYAMWQRVCQNIKVVKVRYYLYCPSSIVQHTCSDQKVIAVYILQHLWPFQKHVDGRFFTRDPSWDLLIYAVIYSMLMCNNIMGLPWNVLQLFYIYVYDL